MESILVVIMAAAFQRDQHHTYCSDNLWKGFYYRNNNIYTTLSVRWTVPQSGAAGTNERSAVSSALSANQGGLPQRSTLVPVGRFSLGRRRHHTTTAPDSTPPPSRISPSQIPIQQSQALRLAPSRCWPGQLCALRALRAPFLYVHGKSSQPSPRARQTPEPDGNAASGDAGSSMVHMGADGR